MFVYQRVDFGTEGFAIENEDGHPQISRLLGGLIILLHDFTDDMIFHPKDGMIIPNDRWKKGGVSPRSKISQIACLNMGLPQIPWKMSSFSTVETVTYWFLIWFFTHKNGRSQMWYRWLYPIAMKYHNYILLGWLIPNWVLNQNHIPSGKLT